ncbi:unnamed protein product [Cunninghamella blakesleeana]
MDKSSFVESNEGKNGNSSSVVIHTTRSTKYWSLNNLKHYFPRYTLKQQGVIYIDERPPILECILMGIQHVLAMFGSTVIAPMLMGLNTNTALFFSGVGTIIFYIATGGRVPSYVGSSFAFIGVVASSTGYVYSSGSGINPRIDVAAGGILICGIVYAFISVLVIFLGYKWIEFLLPPVVTGAVIMTIGIHLATSAYQTATTTSFDGWMAFTTCMIISLTSIYAPGIFKRIPILIGMIISYLIYMGCSFTSVGPEIDYTEVYNAPWFAAPYFTRPVFDGPAISMIVPVCVVLVAENLGHIKAVSVMADTSLDKYMGRALLGDAIATIISSSCGGGGVTTYSENLGVMAVTNVFSTVIFLVAAIIAILLGFIQKFGAAIHTIPPGVFGGLSIILFSLITMSGARIWVENQVDFKDTRNLLVAGIPVILGASMQGTLKWGNFQLDGIGLPTYLAILLYQILRGWDGFLDLYKKYQHRKLKQQKKDEALKKEEEHI